MTVNRDMPRLAKTRAEEHEADVWGEFFIPPYFEHLGLKTATKSAYITGKRGCGKTMLLKYFDYHTAFSERRKDIPENEIEHVGIYWRVDTQFCSSLNHRGLNDEEWSVVFESYFALVISVELIRAVRAIATSAYPNFESTHFNLLNLPSAADFSEDFPSSAKELMAALERKRRLFSTWISNIRTSPRPELPPGRLFIESLVHDLRAQPSLCKLSVHVYVDEVENLVPYQRRVLNSFLKHSQRPLIVSFTSKEQPNDNLTSGPESINATHDYRLIDLDKLLDGDARNLFFAEVFLSNLRISESRPTDDRLLTLVRSPQLLYERKSASHRSAVLDEIREKFPTKTIKEFAKGAVKNSAIRDKLLERIEKALRNRMSVLKADAFVRDDFAAEAIIVTPALLNRATLKPDDVMAELEKFRAERTGSFSTSWIHNNLFGAILELYRPYGRECPLYSGFDTLCTMASNNLRNFLILCYKTLEIADLRGEGEPPFSVEVQCRAAYEAADQLIKEIRTFGPSGEQLRVFVLRLGSIFRALQASPSMSEPEQNQITINSGTRSMTREERAFISEALKYAILVEQLETKTKSGVGQDIVDYQLNPIYAPYFQISYRRKRKIDLSVEQFHLLLMGTETEFRDLASSLTRTPIESNGIQLDLL